MIQQTKTYQRYKDGEFEKFIKDIISGGTIIAGFNVIDHVIPTKFVLDTQGLNDHILSHALVIYHQEK